MKNYIDDGTKHYYAGDSYMGVNMSYDSPCWVAYAFGTRAERDQWLEDNKYNDQGNITAEPISRRIAYKIAGVGKYDRPYTGECNRLEGEPVYYAQR
jgi:hypothetical protein